MPLALISSLSWVTALEFTVMKISIAVATVMAAMAITIFQRSERPSVAEGGVATRMRTSETSMSSLDATTSGLLRTVAGLIRAVEPGRGPCWGIFPEDGG